MSALPVSNVLEATTAIALADLEETAPVALDLLRLSAFLGPGDIPKFVMLTGAEELPEQLRRALGSSIGLNDLLGVLAAHSLVDSRIDAYALRSGTQDHVVARLSHQDRRTWANAAGRCLLAAVPHRPEDWRTWFLMSPLVPLGAVVVEHLEAVGDQTDLAPRILVEQARYLQSIGGWGEATAYVDLAIRQLEARDSGETETFAAALGVRGGVQLATGSFNEAELTVERALAIRRAIHDPTDGRIADSLAQLGNIYSKLGRYDEARDQFNVAIDLHSKAYGPESPEVADDLTGLGGALLGKGSFTAALEAWGESRRILESRYGPGDVDAELLRFFEGAFGAMLRGEQVEVSEFEELIGNLEAVYGPEHHEVASARYLLAMWLAERGNHATALFNLEKALAIHVATYGPKHPDVVDDLGLLAVIHWATGHEEQGRMRLEQAAEAVASVSDSNLEPFLRLSGLQGSFERMRQLPDPVAAAALKTTIDILRSKLGDDHPAVAGARAEVGRAYLEKEDFEAAEQELQQAFTIYAARFGDFHAGTAATQMMLAEVSEARNDYVTGLARREEARRIHIELFGDSHYDVALDDLGMMGDLIAMGRPAEAKDRLEAGVTAIEAVFGPDNPTVARLRWQAGELFEKLGDQPSAMLQMESAVKTLEKWPGTEGERGQRLMELAQRYRLQGNTEQARAAMESAIVLGETDDRVQAIIALAVLLAESHEHEEARSRLNEALALLAERSEDDPATDLLVDAWVRLGDALVSAGDLDHGEREYERALEVAERTATRVDDAAIVFRIGYLEAHRGQTEVGLDRIRLSVRLLREGGEAAASWYSRTHDYAAMIQMLGPSPSVEKALAIEAETEKGRV